MLLCLIVALPFIASLCAAFLSSRSRNVASWLAGTVALASTLLAASLYRKIAAGEVVRFVASWAPQYGLEFNLRMDGFAWMFTMLVSGMGVLVVLYARYYMSAADPVPRFFAFLLAFMGSMLGVVLSGNLIQLVIFWELTSLSSFMLIAYWYHREDARRGARMSLIVTVGGGFALLLGVMVLGRITGSYDLDTVLVVRAISFAHIHTIRSRSCWCWWAVFTKSAQFPFHFWLPQAMAAPTPVSAYLHSATMVKAGVFLLVAALARTLRHGTVVLAGVRRGRDHAAAGCALGHLPARHEGGAGLFHHQSPRAHHHAAGHEQRAGTGGRGVPHHESRDLQGVAVHGHRYRRSRNRHTGSATPGRPATSLADHGPGCDGGGGRDGGRASPEWIPVEGDVLFRIAPIGERRQSVPWRFR